MSFSKFSTTFLNPNNDHEGSDFDFDFDHHPHRDLAKAGPIVVDFTALAMAVVAMSLLMIVAILRHKIDHLARGKEFFENVLEAAYHELSTLGIVEAVIFLVHHYYQGLNIEVERVFAEVHFTLFFVAIINAIMSCLLYFFATHVAEKQWDMLETVDIDHYVAVRRQFDAMEEQLQFIRDSERFSAQGLNSAGGTADGGVFLKLLNYTKFPLLKAKLKQVMDVKYKKLLVQVRFHELRLHFIESNGLDAKFRVSAYLKLCMNDVFKKLVHISTFSWLTLLACTNVLYFITGVIASESKDSGSIGKTLSFVYIGYAIAFVLVSLLTAWKMKHIFFKIMQNEQWITRDGDGADPLNHSSGRLPSSTPSQKRFSVMLFSSERGVAADTSGGVGGGIGEDSGGKVHVHQLEYFWGADPTYIVVLCQFMQFGFALSLSILLVFNQAVLIKETPFKWVGWYFVVPAVCYFLFMWIWSSVIPQYTQCTSLGELVNEKHLNDTQAMFELHEARSHRLDELDFFEAKGRDLTSFQKKRRKKNTKKKEKDSMMRLNFFQKMMTGGTGGSGSLRTMEAKDDSDLGDSGHGEDSLSGSQRLVQLTELVKRPSKDLPDIKPRARRPRNRSVSDGVAAMRIFSNTSALAAEALKSEEVPLSTTAPPPFRLPPVKLGAIDDAKARPRPRRQKAVSTGVFMMQSEKTAPLVDEGGADDGKKFRKTIATGAEDLNKESQAKLQMPPLRPCPLETLGNCMFPMKELPQDWDEMPKSLQQKKFITPITEEEDGEEEDNDVSDDEDSIVSFASEGVPDINDFDLVEEAKQEIGTAERLRGLYVKKSYRQASGVFGTMVAFFMVAIRIELILLDICAINDNQNTWNFVGRQTAFWIVVIWLCIFIAEGITHVLLFRKSNSNRDLVIAGLFDCALSIACLAIFLRAEVERCCDCDKTTSYRFLAETSDSYDTSTCDRYHYCCPKFGDRLCGGVGNLEPITAIIAFRLLRFAFAKRTFHFFNKKDSFEPDNENDDESNEKVSENIQGTLKLSKSSKKKHETDFEHATGSIAQLWTAAILKYPDIVAQHGMFSGLLLEAMLGIDPAPPTKKSTEISSPKKTTLLLENETAAEQSRPSLFRKRSIFDRQMGLSRASSEGSTGMNNNEDNEYNFIRPAAALMRSMRRCQCKWLPLLDEWEVVDVVLTTYEIVWLGPKPVSGLWDDHIDSKRDAVKHKLRNQQGGKGMSLCDVVVGREVLGRLPLNDIHQIKVQRLPLGQNHASKRKRRRDVEDVHGIDKFESEFWADSKDDRQMYKENSDSRWSSVMEDDLILHSPQGALHLRFLVDLLDEEAKEKKTVDCYSFETKKGALLWCQTVSHLCGPQQLKQPLQHLGGKREDELLDFVEVVDPKKFRKNWNRKQF